MGFTAQIDANIDGFKKGIDEATGKLKELSGNTSVHVNKVAESFTNLNTKAKSISNASMGFNSLNMSIQQVVRELPAATMGANMFFLAIGNNLPILADNIKRVKIENELLKASGQSTVSVFKQVTGSLFSWQSALIVGITLLTVYGKDIMSWINKLVLGKDAVDKLTNAQLGLEKASKTVYEAIGKDTSLKNAIVSIEKMKVSLINAKDNQELGRKTVDAYNKSLGETFGKATDVSGALKNISDNEKSYVDALGKMAIANAFFSKSAEDAVKIMNLSNKGQQQLIREGGGDAKSMFKEWNNLDKAIKESEASANRMKKKFGSSVMPDVDVSKWYNVDYISYKEAFNKRNELARKMIKISDEERKRQLDILMKDQGKSLEEAKKYMKEYTRIYSGSDLDKPVSSNTVGIGKNDVVPPIWESQIKAAEEAAKKIEILNLKTLKANLISEDRYNFESERLALELLKKKKSILEDWKQSTLDVTIDILTSEIKFGNLEGKIPNKLEPLKLDTVIVDASKIDTSRIWDGVKKSIQEEKDKLSKELIDISSSIEGAISDFASSLGTAIGEGDFSNFGANILDGVGKFAQSFGALVLSAGIAALNLQKLMLNPVTAIAAGAALIALGAAVSGAAKKMVKDHSASGFSGGARSNYSTTSSSGMGASELKGAYNDFNVTFKIGANELVGVLNTAEQRKKRL